MGEIRPLHPQKFVTGIAEHVAQAIIDLNPSHLDRTDGHSDQSLLEITAKSLFACSKGLLCRFPLRDVQHGPDNSPCLAKLIVCDACPIEDVGPDAIGPQESVLGSPKSLRTLGGFLQAGNNPIAILRMDLVAPPLPRTAGFEWPTETGGVVVVPTHSPVEQVAVPYGVVRSSYRHPQPLFALSQCLLGPFTLGDVGYHAGKTGGIPILVLDQKAVLEDVHRLCVA